MTNALASSDQKKIINIFLDLIAHLNESEIHIDVNDENDSRCAALAFALESIYHIYFKANWQLVIHDLVNKVKALKSKEELSWILDREIESLFKVRTAEFLATVDDSQRQQVIAVADLFLAAKKNNHALYQQGQSVHFGGIPREFLPSWYREGLYRES